MKITLYTITDCPFSKQEREYLSAHGLTFEEKNLETNREFLTEMLAVGSNFAGTPVTKIEKDDGQIAVLKGFTASEFDTALGFGATSPVEPIKTEEAPKIAEAQSGAPVAPSIEVSPPVEVVPPMEVAPVEILPPAPTPVADPAMTSVLNTLEQQAQVATPVAPPAPVAQEPTIPPAPPAVGSPVVIPDPQF